MQLVFSLLFFAMKYKILLAFLAILALILFALRAKSQTVNVKIIVTSDLHGHFLPYNYQTKKEISNSLASIANYINEQRKIDSQHVVLLDNGDILQGTPLVYFSNFYQSDSQNITSRMLNYLKYDAASIGNHDIETGHEVYDKFVGECNFPVLAANALHFKTKEPYFKPYHIIERGKVKIVVLGLITPAIPNWLPPSIYEGIVFSDMIESAREWSKIILQKEKPDLLIGLFHSGFDYNYNGYNEQSFKNENASKLIAKKVEGFDIVIAGHDHSMVSTSITNDFGKQVVLLNPGGLAEFIGVANCTFKLQKDKVVKTKIESKTEKASDFVPDSAFLSTFQPFHNQVLKYIERPIGKISQTLITEDVLFGPGPLLNLIHQMQLQLTGADISFSSPFSLNTRIEKGELTIANMFSLYKFENLLYTMRLSGSEIHNYLEFSYGLWYATMTDENDNLLLFSENGTNGKTGKLKNPVYNLSSAAGIDYVVDVRKPFGERIEILGFSNGKAFSPDSVYLVALNSYRAHGGGNHLTKGAGIAADKLIDRIASSTEKDLRFYLTQWIENQKEINPPVFSNWKIIPHDWVEKAKPGDVSKLFPK